MFTVLCIICMGIALYLFVWVQGCAQRIPRDLDTNAKWQDLRGGEVGAGFLSSPVPVCLLFQVIFCREKQQRLWEVYLHDNECLVTSKVRRNNTFLNYWEKIIILSYSYYLIIQCFIRILCVVNTWTNTESYLISHKASPCICLAQTPVDATACNTTEPMLLPTTRWRAKWKVTEKFIFSWMKWI